MCLANELNLSVVRWKNIRVRKKEHRKKEIKKEVTLLYHHSLLVAFNILQRQKTGNNC